MAGLAWKRFVKKQSPIVSEFETQEQAGRYECWFRAKVNTSMNAAIPNVPHNEVMAGARKVIEKSNNRRRLA
ncbi:stability determinant [Sodalis ligni]|uniref:type II toxin-antitoxin system RelB family antitoxin n=1 Tax=Sodalis ligni TaxID=2697027 RepID=UPI00193EEA9C|nr:stability determinant [Sodalis ligni]QWA13769.1 stability determinant [Sodalis ligni]